MGYRFIKRWDVNTNVGWWKESRAELNKVIDAYNDWQIHDNCASDKAEILLRKIEYGKQTIGAQDGGEGYLEELENMEKFVRSLV